MAIIYTLLGVPYVAVLDPVRGVVLQKAARRKSTLNTGDTKVVNGVTYTLNENRRWARADKKSRSRKPSAQVKPVAPPAGALPIIDAPKVKGKTRQMTAKPSMAKPSIEETAKQTRRSAARSMSLKEPPQPLKPKEKLAQVRPKVKAQAAKKERKDKPISRATYLEGADWNPDAIPDLTIEAFGQYLTIKANIVQQENPKSQWNQTQKETGLSRVYYRSAISTAIEHGFIPSDAAIAEAKLNKTELRKIEANRKLQEQWKRQTEQVEKALNASMADDKANRDWKPQMTEEEAQSYAEDGFFGSMNWYHGNSQSVTDSIATEGAQPERNRRGMYGQGVYFGIDRSIGEDYASGASFEAEVITTKIRAKKPYVTTRTEINKVIERLAEFSYTDERDTGSIAINQYLRAKGYDSIYLQDVGYGIAFDTKQVITVAREAIDSSQKQQFSDRIKQVGQMRADQGSDFVEAWRQNPNAQVLSGLKLTQPGQVL